VKPAAIAAQRMRTSLALAVGGAGVLMLGATLAIIGKALELEQPARSQGAVAWGVVLMITGLALGASAAVTILSDPSVHPPASLPGLAGQAPAVPPGAPAAGPARDPGAGAAPGPPRAAPDPDVPWDPADEDPPPRAAQAGPHGWSPAAPVPAARHPADDREGWPDAPRRDGQPGTRFRAAGSRRTGRSQ
jgi:hypothetical protein